MRKITKLFANDSIKTIDEKTRTATYIISTDDVDRMGEIVEQSWDLENYKKNPIVLWGHDPSNPDNVLGKALEIETTEHGGKNITKAVVQFAEEGTSRGVDTVWKLVKQGILKTVSVGFIPHDIKEGDAEKGADAILANNELLEFSIVGIPANPNAVALAYNDGSIDEKDAKWLMKQYEKETTYLQKSVYDTMKPKNDNATNTQKELAMSDEDIQKLAGALGTAVSEALGGKLDAILEAVSAEEKPEEKPAEDEETSLSADTEEDTSAKSEQTEEADDDGAFDENEELTEEEEKAFLASLEKDFSEGEETDENS